MPGARAAGSNDGVVTGGTVRARAGAAQDTARSRPARPPWCIIWPRMTPPGQSWNEATLSEAPAVAHLEASRDSEKAAHLAALFTGDLCVTPYLERSDV